MLKYVNTEYFTVKYLYTQNTTGESTSFLNEYVLKAVFIC